MTARPFFDSVGDHRSPLALQKRFSLPVGVFEVAAIGPMAEPQQRRNRLRRSLCRAGTAAATRGTYAAELASIPESLVIARLNFLLLGGDAFGAAGERGFSLPMRPSHHAKPGEMKWDE